MTNKTLWKKIDSFQFDIEISEYGFSTRLAFEKKWTINFTQKAIAEYKKFMYLAAISNQMVSPSPIVDIVWHQHLIFTKSYTDFCEILSKKIEHIPSTHNIKEEVKFKKAKEFTTQIYESEFGKQPDEFWLFHNINDSLGFENAKYTPEFYFYAACTSFILLIFPFCLVLKPIYTHINSGYFILGYTVLFTVTYLFLDNYNKKYLSNLLETIPKTAAIFDLTISELIVLKTGKIENVVHGFVNQLILDKIVFVSKSNQIFINGEKNYKNPFEKTIVDEINLYESIQYYFVVNKMKAKPIFQQLENTKNEIDVGYTNSKQFLKLLLINFCVIIPLILLAVSRLFIGFYRGKSIAFILIISGLVVFFFVYFINRLNEYFTTNFIPNWYKEKSNVSKKLNSKNWEWSYFLLGSAVFANSFYDLTHNVNNRLGRNNNNNGSSCGGDGGSCGSGCGGGCGGCGGGD